MKDLKNLRIQKVENGYIVREHTAGDFVSNELAVFNDVENLCDWIKQNFKLDTAPQNPWSPDAPIIARGANPMGYAQSHAVLDPAVCHASQSHGGL